MPAERELDPTESIQAYIGNMVREERKKRGWTLLDLAEKAYSNKTTLSDVENGSPPDRKLAEQLAVALDFGRYAIVHLLKIIENQTVRDYAVDFLAKQSRASLIHTSSFIVPGLLQTPDYARELLLAGQAGDPKDIDSYVAQRMERQSVWQREDPPWLSAVISEAVLHQAGRAQLTRLLESQELPQVTIRLLPFDAGQIMGTVVLLSLPDGSRGAYTEGFLTGNYSEDMPTVLRYQRVYDRYASAALTAEATTDRIHEALKRAT